MSFAVLTSLAVSFTLVMFANVGLELVLATALAFRVIICIRVLALALAFRVIICI